MLDDTEAISNSTFRCLIEDAAKDNQSIIFARLQTRDKADFRKKYYHHFYGPNLIKILFKVFNLPGSQVLQSRYHQDYPIVVKNPLTNQVIVGEVDFFVLDSAQISARIKKPSEASDDCWIHPRSYNANYFGSDFHYATQQDFRFKFRSLTQDTSLIELGLIADVVDNGEARDDANAANRG